MYSQKTVERSIDRIFKETGIKLKRYKIQSCMEMAESISKLYDDVKKVYSRDLTEEEQKFVKNEQLMCSIDYNYWVRRYAKIKTKAPGPAKPYVPWESQQLLHDLMAELEDTAEERQDGILIANLKARQLGMSTIYESVLSHLGFYKYGFTGLLAADEQDQSEYLFGMMERFYENLPVFLKPERTFHVKGTQMAFRSMDTLLVVQHGRLKADIGRGKTIHGVHLSELEKWDDTEQIDDGLLPALPRLPSTIGFFESTGEYRGSWWHVFCEDCMAKANRFTMFFVPWYAEPNTYVKPAPIDWNPDSITLQHAVNVLRDSPQWMRGRSVRLSKDQMYFWEFTRNEYARKGKLGVFFCEYASSPKEAFRAANSSVFSYEVIEYLNSKTSFPDVRELLGPNIDHDALRISQSESIKKKSRRVG